MILAYPVITSGEFAHRDSFINLLKDRYEQDLALVSLENQVSPDTPPAFIWHTFDDGCVPVENSLLLANALRKQGISFEMHIFPSGPHGLSLATDETGILNEGCRAWTEMAGRWIHEL
jgi:acetyl esterase/lipase